MHFQFKPNTHEDLRQQFVDLNEAVQKAIRALEAMDYHRPRNYQTLAGDSAGARQADLTALHAMRTNLDEVREFAISGAVHVIRDRERL